MAPKSPDCGLESVGRAELGGVTWAASSRQSLSMSARGGATAVATASLIARSTAPAMATSTPPSARSTSSNLRAR